MLFNVLFHVRLCDARLGDEVYGESPEFIATTFSICCRTIAGVISTEGSR